MGTEEKAKAAAVAVREAAKTPLFAAMPAAKKAVIELADAVEALAHEVAILKLRLGATLQVAQGGGNGYQG